jgi:hypothetical protein
MEVAILIWIVCGIAAAAIASNRGANGCLWFGLGILLGPIGLALSFGAGAGRQCPECRKNIHQDATRCPHCQADLLSDEEEDAGPEATKRCPFCAETILDAAIKCRYCGEALSPGHGNDAQRLQALISDLEKKKKLD